MKKIPACATTGVGSVPFLDLDDALALIGRTLDIPHWPQFVKRAAREDMVLQAADGLPLMEADENEHRVVVRSEGREGALTEFYERFLASDLDYFGVPGEAEIGLTGLLKKAEEDPDFGPDFLKAQVIGPISFGLTVKTPDGKNLVNDPDLFDAVVKGLGMKAAWLADRIRKTGRTPIVFLDEPGLSGFGSAFSTLKSDQVVSALGEAAELARSGGDAYVGLHICGNTDWGLMVSSKIDIINFDAFGYLDQFLLYPNQLRDFLRRGGYVDWGGVPTHAFTGRETAREIADKVASGWRVLAGHGIDPELIRRRSLISTSCGTGTMTDENARRVYQLLPEAAGLLKG